MRLGRLRIVARGWPWQRVEPHWASHVDGTVGERYGWNPFSVKGMGRFGGGWAIKVGVMIGGNLREWIFELGIGTVSVRWEKKGGTR